MKFPNLNTIDPEEIDNLLLQQIIDNHQGTIFHDKKINELISKYYNTKFLYLVDDLKDFKIISPLHITSENLQRKYCLWPSFDIPYGGFIGEYFYDLKLVRINTNETFIYAGSPLIDFSLSDQFQSAPKLGWQETSMINLSESLDTIFNQTLNSKRRNMIRKAIKSNIEVKIFDSVDKNNDFFSLLMLLHRRLGYEILNPSYYFDLLAYYIPKNKAKLLVAYKNNIALSGIMLIGNQNFIHYYKGCSADNIKNEGQGELLQWEAIKWAHSIGAKYYDLCGLNKEKLPHLYLFKTGISDKIFYYPVSSKSGLLYKIMNKIYKTL